MKLVIRMFALLVAFAGLVSASFTPATARVASSHSSMTATDPDPSPLGGLPGPPPCTFTDSCLK